MLCQISARHRLAAQVSSWHGIRQHCSAFLQHVSWQDIQQRRDSSGRRTWLRCRGHIANEQLADNKQYHELLQKKIASQDALRSLISEEAWKRYLDLDAVGNELESFRLETMYLAGAADYEKLFK